MKLNNTHKRLVLALAAACATAAAYAAPALARGTLSVTADRMAADNITGTVVASGNVRAVAYPLCLLSDLVSKRDNVYEFTDPTSITSCTNDIDHLHWSITGNVVYREREALIVRDLVFRAWGVPVAWFPYWYHPLNTDYGLRMMPGYTSRWGAYLLTKYVYGIAGGFGEGEWGLRGSTRFDMRTKNGIALGQGVKWQLGDFGRGKFKAYYAWDDDADHYDNHWDSPTRHHYENWGSKVHDERYGFMLEHLWDATERDTVRIKGSYYSDSHFRRDFLRDGLFGTRNRFLGHEGNEAAWEHVEHGVGTGISVSGPLNNFYGGVARLPEAYFDIQPTPLPFLPLNYESSTRAGMLNREYAKYGERRTETPFRYVPGEWADYQAFRFDTYHRVTLPFRIADVVSVVPRAAVRGTYWSDTGVPPEDGYGRSGSTGDGAWRSIVEGGTTFSARGSAYFAEGWQHLIEPYFDVLAQEAEYHGLKSGARPYYFDSIDGSRDWLDQFAGRSRNLPYSWYGVTPGLRNAIRRADDSGHLRTIFDFDAYAAIQFNDTSWTDANRNHRLSKHPEDPNYGRHNGAIFPGFRTRWFPAEDCALMARVEFDPENKRVAYSDIAWNQVLTKRLKYELSFASRDHRRWDYASAPYDEDLQRNEDFNWAKYSMASVKLEHELMDSVSWGPFVRWDCREAELDEIGAWLDFRTDCLGFRFSVSYENEYRRIDYSKSDDDWRFGFFVYLRALGPESGAIFGGK